MTERSAPWLDDPRDERTRAWVQRHSIHAEEFLESAGARDELRARVRDVVDRDRRGMPEIAGNTRFELQRGAGEAQWSLWTFPEDPTDPGSPVKMSARGAEGTCLIDASELSEDGNTAITLTSPSPDGTLVAWALARGGSDWQTIRVRDVATGEDLPDEITWIKAAQAAWTQDGRGFFYLDFSAPRTDDVLVERNSGQCIRYHALGSDAAHDPRIFELPGADWLSVTTEPEHDALIIEATDGTTTTSIHVGRISEAIAGTADFHAHAEDGAPMSYIGWCDGPVHHSFIDGADHLRRTVDGATSEIRPPAGPLNPWAAVIVDRHLVVSYRSGAAHSLGWIDLDTGGSSTAVLEDGLFVNQFEKGPGSTVLVGATGWVIGERILALDPISGSLDILTDDVVQPVPAHRKLEVRSDDGTAVPVTLLAADGTDPGEGPRPTLLVGYGGYSADFLTYGFEEWHQVWLDLGGTIALAGIRGGSENGEAWHVAATREHKVRSYEDFLAVAEHLIENRVTSRDLLAINGMSNGGLLIGVAMTERPDLFGACVPEVGVMDMLRFHLYTVGAGWIREFGDPEDAADAARLRTISPLHRLRAGVDYPPTLVVTADQDDRVVPGPHSYQFFERLQQLAPRPGDHLLRVQSDAGHAAGRSVSAYSEERGDILCFLAEHLLDQPLALVATTPEGVSA